jgi:hypothetical protein
MIRFFGKLGFIHRQLWRQDSLYRAGLLFGPAPLAGGVLAAVLWWCISTFGGSTGAALTHQPLPRWATPQGPNLWHAATDQAQVVQPAAPLPPIGTDGALPGYQAGWQAHTSPIQVSPTFDVNVDSTPLTAFTFEGPGIDMARIMAEGPKSSLYVGVGTGFLAIRTAGIYALSLRLDRAAAPSAQCLLRLGFGRHRVVSNLEVGLVSPILKTYDAARFDLQPGLYPIGWAFGCWHGHDMIGPGQMTLLIGPPGGDLLPARADAVVRREPSKG